LAGDVISRDSLLSCGRGQDCRKAPQRRRLSGSVGADQAIDLTRIAGQCGIGHGVDDAAIGVFVRFGQMMDFDQISLQIRFAAVLIIESSANPPRAHQARRSLPRHFTVKFPLSKQLLTIPPANLAGNLLDGRCSETAG
jgi:hypothetical protein